MSLKIVPVLLVGAFAPAVMAADEPELFGIGAVLAASGEDTGPIIQSVLPNSPAARAKLAVGMIISGISGKPTAGMDLEECVKLIRGEPGTPLLIEITDPTSGKATSVVLFRAKLELGGGQE